MAYISRVCPWGATTAEGVVDIVQQPALLALLGCHVGFCHHQVHGFLLLYAHFLGVGLGHAFGQLVKDFGLLAELLG